MTKAKAAMLLRVRCERAEDQVSNFSESHSILL